MAWTLPKPWENGYVPVTDPKIGTQGTDGNTRIRRWKKDPTPKPFSFTDNFVGVAGDLSARTGWTKLDGGRSAALTGDGAITHGLGSAPDSAYLCPDLLTPKHFVQCIVGSTTNSFTFNICGRILNGQTYVGLRRQHNQWQLYTVIAGAFNLSGVSNDPGVSGDVLRLEFDGNTVKTYRNGSILIGTGPVPIPGSFATYSRAGFVVRDNKTRIITGFSAGAF